MKMNEDNENEDIGEQLEFVIDSEYEGQRVDAFLGGIIPEQSRSYIQKLIGDSAVSINGKIETSKNKRLKVGDVVIINIPLPEALAVEPEDIPIKIVYEDDYLIVVDKPQGMVVHPAPGNYSGTLVNALLFHAASLSSINGVIRPGIVHRIDKDTSGLLVIAKTNTAHQGLAEQFKDHSIERMYLAVVQGVPKNASGTVDAPIARNPKDRFKMAVVSGGRRAVTHYEVLEDLGGYALVACRLETGRTHQIRVHMAYIGHPLIGDPLYNPHPSKIKFEGQMLHAKVLGFVHPVTGEHLRFETDLSKSFEEGLKKIRK